MGQKVNERQFLEKRQRFMQQLFIENEYKKRHFIMYNDVSKYEDVITTLENKVIYSHNERVFEIDDCVCKKKYNLECDHLSFVDSEMSKKIIDAEIESRSNYGIPFYNLIMPCESSIIYQSILGKKFDVQPIVPDYFGKDEFVTRILVHAILSYTCNEHTDKCYFDEEKKYVLEYIEKKLADGIDIKYIASILAYFKSGNGHELSNFEFQLLNDGIDTVLSNEMRSNSLEQRFLGLFIFDFMLSVAVDGVNRDINAFLKIFHNELKIKEQKNSYLDNVQKKYRDALRIAIMCVKEGKIVPTVNSNTLDELPQVILPSHVPFYHDFRKLYKEWKSC